MNLSKITGFFSTKKVKQKITSGTFPEGQAFLYFYLTITYDAIGFTQQYIATAGKQPATQDWVNVWGYLIITATGLIAVFLANGGSSGRNFFMKYFPLSFTVGFKYGIAYLISGVLPVWIPSLESLVYGIGSFVILNVLMVANIAWQMHSVRQEIGG